MSRTRKSTYPEAGDFFRVRGDAGFFYRFCGAREQDFGGAVGKAVQARRCSWDDALERLDEIGDGCEEWVQASNISKVYLDRVDADEEALEELLRAGAA